MNIVDTYNTIYEIDLVVANIDTTLEELKKTYCYSDGVELDSAITDGYATTSCCINKKTNKQSILVKHNKQSDIKGEDKKIALINTCAHEAVHVFLDIHRSIGEGVCLECQEPTAYFIGWATECIYKTLTKNDK